MPSPGIRIKVRHVTALQKLFIAATITAGGGPCSLELDVTAGTCDSSEIPGCKGIIYLRAVGRMHGVFGMLTAGCIIGVVGGFAYK